MLVVCGDHFSSSRGFIVIIGIISHITTISAHMHTTMLLVMSFSFLHKWHHAK
jgi:hypothetical protein